MKPARVKGVKFGPMPKLSPDQFADRRELSNQGTILTCAAQMIGFSRATVYRALLHDAAKF